MIYASDEKKSLKADLWISSMNLVETHCARRTISLYRENDIAVDERLRVYGCQPIRV